MKLPALTPWQLIERRPLVQRSFLTLWQDHVRLPSGAEIDDFCVIEAPDWAAVLRHPGAHLHLYGKRETRPGRKMGHVTVCEATLERALEVALAIRRALAIEG